MARTIVRSIEGESIWLEETTEISVFIFWLAMILMLIGGIAFFYTLASAYSDAQNMYFNDTTLKIAIVSVAGAGFIMVASLFGLFDKPTYVVSTNTTGSEVVPIRNDGTDQARVCIAVNALDREIKEELKERKKLQEIAARCK